MSDLFQWAIIAFVVLSILYHVWKGGAANPQGTGKLGREMSGLSGRVSNLSGRVKHVEVKIDQLEQEAATTEDVRQLEKLVDEKINTLSARMDGHHELSKATNRGVARIEHLLIEKGLGK